MFLTDRCAIYVYFDLIKQLEPKRILDIGMFLKRTGTISRRMMARRVPESVKLDGIDFFPEINFPVWKNVYDEVWDEYTFFQNKVENKYDCAFLLGMKESEPEQGWLSRYTWEDWIAKLSKCTQYILFKQAISGKEEGIESKARCIPVKVGEDTFYLLDFGE